MNGPAKGLKGLGPIVPRRAPAKRSLRQALGLTSKNADRLLTLRAQYVDFLPEREALGGRQHSPLATMVVGIVAAFFFLFLGWAWVSNVESAVTGLGQVRPDGRVKVVNFPEAGRVTEILVRDGDTVRPGQVLFRLDPELLQEEVARFRSQWQQAAADAARLDAEAQNLPAIQFPDAVRRERADLVLSQTRLFEARRQALQARRDGAERQIEQRSADLAALDSQLTAKGRGHEILKQQAASLEELTGKGYFPWLRYQSVLRDLTEAEGEVRRLQNAMTGARAALAEARTRRRQVDEDWSSALFDELARARTERDTAAAAFAQSQARMRNLVITAPDAGIIQGLAVNNIGQAIRPLEPLANVVPVSDNLVIETRIANQDIGYITIGQKARVKVHAYDSGKYGALDGIVEQISPDAFTDPDARQVYFKVIVRTDRSYLGPAAGERPVTPGMQVDVDMITGERSILSYLTDRLIDTTSNAFKEQ